LPLFDGRYEIPAAVLARPAALIATRQLTDPTRIGFAVARRSASTGRTITTTVDLASPI
jgi:hypothetical protein